MATAALLPAGRRLRTPQLGPAPVGRRGRPGGARPDRVGPAVASDAASRRLGRVRHPAGRRHQAGELHHAPASGDTVPTTREPGGDRSFVPLDGTDVWLVQGDPTVYTSQPAGTRSRTVTVADPLTRSRPVVGCPDRKIQMRVVAMRVRRPVVAAVALLLALPVAVATGGGTGAAAAACDPFTTTPTYDPAVPTAKSVLGFDLGQREVTTAESDRYLRAIDAASPRGRRDRCSPPRSRAGRCATPSSARPPGSAAAQAGRDRPLRDPADDPGAGRGDRRDRAGDPLGRGQRARRRGERHRRVAAGALRAGGPHRLRRRPDPRQRGRRDPADPEPGRPRARHPAQRLRLRHEPRLVRPHPAGDRRQARGAAAATRRCCSSTRTRWAARTTSSRRTPTRSTTRSPTSRCRWINGLYGPAMQQEFDRQQHPVLQLRASTTCSTWATATRCPPPASSAPA